MAEIGAAWRDRVASFLEGFVMTPLKPAADVVPALLGQDVVPVGAALAAMHAGRS